MLNRKSTRLLALFLWAAGIPFLCAQTTRVEGTVRDSTGAVIADASVVLNSGSYQAAATTDAHGHFLFSAVPSNSGRLEITREGFGPVHQSWNGGLGAGVSLEILMQPASAGEE